MSEFLPSHIARASAERTRTRAWRRLLASVVVLIAAVFASAERPSIPTINVLNEGSSKRPGTVKMTQRTVGVLPVVLTDLTGASEVEVLNFTDQKLCLWIVPRTSAAVPTCPLASVCASPGAARINTIAAEAFPLPKSDQYGYGILCGNTVGAVTNGESVYTVERDQ